MSESRRSGPGIDARLRKWESVLLMVFLVDLLEDRVLFRTREIPAWGKIAIKMALVIGVLGILLNFVNRRLDRGVSSAHALSNRLVIPGIAVHALLFGSVFVGYYWLKLGRWPWA